MSGPTVFIHPECLGPQHVNLDVEVTLDNGTEIHGRLGTYQREIEWISEKSISERFATHRLHSTTTEFYVNNIELSATTHDKTTIAFKETNK